MIGLLRDWKESFQAADRASLMDKAAALAELLLVQQKINIEHSRELADLRADLHELRAENIGLSYGGSGDG